MEGTITDIINYGDSKRELEEICKIYSTIKDVKDIIINFAHKMAILYAKNDGYFYMTTTEGSIKSIDEVIFLFTYTYTKIISKYVKEHVIKKKDLYYQLEFNL